MKYEVDVCCPECLARIKLYAKCEPPAYMVCMGNADLIHIDCPKCKLGFYIEETDYDRMKRENEE